MISIYSVQALLQRKILGSNSDTTCNCIKLPKSRLL